MIMLLHCCPMQGQLCPTWQSYAGLPPEEGACVTGFSSRPHRHSERSEESRYLPLMKQSVVNTNRWEDGPILRAIAQLHSGRANKRKALLNSRCPLRGHRVYEGKNNNDTHCCSTQGQLCPTWQSYAGLPPEEGACVTGFSSRPHRHSKRSEESRYSLHLRQTVINTSRREGCISADTFRFIIKNCLTVISHLRWLSPLWCLRHHLPPAEAVGQ